jgi:DHA1 family tetracycline resistance protein-like MFS transporter
VPISALTGLRNIKKALGMRDIRMMFVVIFLLSVGFTCFANFFQVYVIDRFHFTPADIGNLFAYIGAWIAFTQGVLTRTVAKKFSPSAVVRIAALGLAASLLAIIVPWRPVGLLFVMPFVSIFQGLIQPNTTAIISNFAGAESQGEIMGISQSVQALAMVFPPLIGGWLAGFHPGAPIVAAAVITLLAWVVFTFVFHPKARQTFHEV